MGDGGAGDRAAQVLRPRRAKQGPSLALALEFLPLMGGAAHFGVPPQSPAHRHSVVLWATPLGWGRFAGSALFVPPGARAQGGRCRPPLAGTRARDLDRFRRSPACLISNVAMARWMICLNPQSNFNALFTAIFTCAIISGGNVPIRLRMIFLSITAIFSALATDVFFNPVSGK